MTARGSDVVVIGAGIVGAAGAFYCAAAGLDVTVVERGPIGGGTTASCEGNILLSDKEPGPELELALLSTRLWSELAEELGPNRLEYEQKGGVVVASTESTATRCRRSPRPSVWRGSSPSTSIWTNCSNSNPTCRAPRPAAPSTRRTVRSSPC